LKELQEIDAVFCELLACERPHFQRALTGLNPLKNGAVFRQIINGKVRRKIQSQSCCAMRMDRDIDSDVHNDVSKVRQPRRFEVLDGSDRRRKWADETKIAIIAEALEPGVVISDVTLVRIAAHYAIEAEIGGKRADERRAIRQARAKPLVDGLEV